MERRPPEVTRITGDLPNMRVEITHRQDAGAEVMTIELTATPSFRAAEPLVGGLLPLMLAFNPFTAWMSAVQALMGMNPLLAPPRK